MTQNISSGLDNLVVTNSLSLREAMEVISANQKGAVVVVGQNNVLVGTLSDGDIRRGLLREASLITPVEKVMNVDPLFLQEDHKISIEDFFQQHPEITVLPLVDAQNCLVKVFFK